jgi:predicted RNA-binding Zn-ribbon protein involved in translation (DUF1610 family)
MNLDNEATTTHRCPQCGTTQVRRTQRFGIVDRVLSLFNAYPYHCVECPVDVRFHRFGRK